VVVVAAGVVVVVVVVVVAAALFALGLFFRNAWCQISMTIIALETIHHLQNGGSLWMTIPY